MNVLHLLASPVWSGPAENVALLAKEQRALGHQVTVAIDLKRARLAYEEPAAPRLRALGLLDESGLELSVKSGPLALLNDVANLRRRRVDVVHAHFSHDHLIARLGRPKGAALIRSIHAPRSLRFSTPRADAWTFPTRALLETVNARGMVLPPLVDPAFVPAADRQALRRELGVTGRLVVGMTSGLQRSRRHALGLAAFVRLLQTEPQAELVIVGDGPLKGALERQAPPAVRFVGYQSGASFVRWLQAFDAVWILGLGNDWSARAAAQARACGARVIGVAEGALPEWVDAVAQDAEAVARATLAATRAERPLPRNVDTARRVLSLYEACRG